MRLLTLEIRLEGDALLTRQRARQIAGLLGFPLLDQTRIATAASEIARNAFQYAGGGMVEFLIDLAPPQGLLIRVHQRGLGTEDFQALLEGRSAQSTGTGMGIGIAGARRLMDRFEINSEPGGGATVTLGKTLPRRSVPLTPQDLGRVSGELTRHVPQGLLDELQHQNQELIRTLQELRDRQAELNEIHHRELDETNRGVVALYAELDDNAMALKRISDLKSRFLSNMSHEFRSPLNTILSLSGFLLERSDGDLNPEQEKQVGFIRKAADGLSALVNDLLDLAKVEAGKAVVRPRSFEVADLFENLRGTTLPLLTQDAVTLDLDEPVGIGTLRTDDGKLGQVLRNFLSNAVKYTERGSIRLRADIGPDDTVVFAVTDTGIGIAPEDHERVFEEFGQIEGPLQGRIKGTGLGLPLSRKLAELLGGSVSVRSEPGVGSTFFATIPRVFRESSPAGAQAPSAARRKPERPPDRDRGRGRDRVDEPAETILIIDDQEGARDVLKGQLAEGVGGPYRVIEAGSGGDGLRRAIEERPGVIFLDLVMPDMTGLQVLDRLKGDDATRAIPVIIHTSKDLDDDERRRLESRTVAILEKSAGDRQGGSEALRQAVIKAGLRAGAGAGARHA